MMQIDSSFHSKLSQPATAAPATSATEKDQFLKLLVAQMQHQDPLNPQDGAAFVAQLAQFSSLEQATETNQRLADLSSAQAATARAGLTAVVGQTISAQTTSVVVGATPPPALSAHLGGAATKVDAVLTDASGKEVRRFSLGAASGGDVAIPWDGSDASGKPLAAGTYKIEIQATGANGAVPATAIETGRVSALEFQGGKAIYRIGAATVDPADIIRIGG
ncbi:MAG TPA: flagellar hook assembly protein FlgD [Haliangiales bacterium]|nr:flagellar hook assembly protein FlgD [Haliangiales bacterium]